ncbi:putative sugar O-methyltransferase [Polynucleobacter sp. MG-6-Vaara-E2]|uniref:putative sugar O-methyltransferase n=1 Tax=Polynucleobacter sp. MG-6-Vaara-E2 TaxID=2576932 RepID=UPI001BFEAE54|nr:putative sugar O-methyltransferase [Polynucleobacter sp. MG-6-Vaara-E2]QWD96913.1 putative sugar O-methyltransferase [Polynucleobacter sp. MG-6-Vaara-E2]
MNEVKETINKIINLRDSKHSNSLHVPSGLWKKWLEKLGFVRELSEKSLREIRLYVGMGFFIGAPWSKAYYQANEIKLQLMQPSDSSYIKDYLRLTKNIPENLKLTELDPTRNEIAIEFNGKYITEDVLRVQSTISNLNNFPKFKSCIEIGGGYGALANQVIKVYEVEKYTIIDYPEMLFFVAIWSKVVNPKLKIVIYDGSNKSELDNAELALVPNFLYKSIQIEGDLLINENSFCEMSQAQVLDYLQAKNLNYNYMYSNNRDRQFMNRDLPEGINSLLERYFQLSPSVQEYKEYYKDSSLKNKWNQKNIFYASKNELLNIDINLINGLSIRTEH